MSLTPEELIKQRLREAKANVEAARRATEADPDDALAATWLEQAKIEGQRALAVAQEIWDSSGRTV